MPLHARRAWTGTIRGELRSAARRLQSLLNYQAKHPTVGFLAPADADKVNAAILVCEQKIAETRLR